MNQFDLFCHHFLLLIMLEMSGRHAPWAYNSVLNLGIKYQNLVNNYFKLFL